MIDIDEELEWVRADRQDRHIGVISKHECVVDVDWLEELLVETKQLRKRNEWLEEVVALLQEEGVDLSMEGYPLWHEDGYMYWRNKQ